MMDNYGYSLGKIENILKMITLNHMIVEFNFWSLIHLNFKINNYLLHEQALKDIKIGNFDW